MNKERYETAHSTRIVWYMRSIYNHSHLLDKVSCFGFTGFPLTVCCQLLAARGIPKSCTWIQVMRFTAQIHPQDLSESCERQTKHVSIHRSYSEVEFKQFMYLLNKLYRMKLLLYISYSSHALNSPLHYASYLKTDNYALMENMQMTSLVAPTLSFMENISILGSLTLLLSQLRNKSCMFTQVHESLIFQSCQFFL